MNCRKCTKNKCAAQEPVFVTELQEMDLMKRDLHKDKPNKNQHSHLHKRTQWDKETRYCAVDDWIKVMFSNKSQVWAGTGVMVQCWGWMSGKGPGEISVIISPVIAKVYKQILDILTPWIILSMETNTVF